MQNLRGKLALRLLSSHSILPQSHIHTSASVEISRKWEKKNKIVYPPQLPGEPRRPAEIYHCRRQIKYSKDKMWYLAKLIRGMSIDQALAQLEFSDKKGAQIIKEVLLEAQDMAVRDHNVEFRSNLYVVWLCSSSFYEMKSCSDLFNLSSLCDFCNQQNVAEVSVCRFSAFALFASFFFLGCLLLHVNKPRLT
ncbi:39S ribosomal protein L22, mitochondrial isoform X4 [Sus scrofa]|nr:39S ribosomal protein L22, mitochondrial isoform X4 [Sus scrofa]